MSARVARFQQAASRWRTMAARAAQIKGRKILRARRFRRKVAKLVNAQEIKQVFTLQNTMATADNSLQGVHLTAVAEGDDYNQRTGRQIQPVGIRLRWVSYGSNNNVGPQPLRIIIVQDMGFAGTVRTGTQLFENYSTTINDFRTMLSDFNSDYVNTRKFNNKGTPIRILYDSGMLKPLLARNATSATVDGGAESNVKTLRVFIPERKLRKVFYSGTAGSDVQAGAIYLYYLVGVDTTAANNNNFAYNAEVLYKDE